MSLFAVRTDAEASLILAYDDAAQRSASTAQRLASGLRINSSVDDASGYAVETGMRTTIDSLDAADGNATQASDAEDIASGALGQVVSIIQRIRVLTVEANSSLLSKSDLADIQIEISELTREINTLAVKTTDDGVPLFAPGNVVGAPRVVQSQTLTATSTGVSTLAFALDHAPSPGNLLIAAMGYGNGI